MKRIGEIAQLPERPKSVRSEWNELVGYFTDKVNSTRRPEDKVMSYSSIANKISVWVRDGEGKKDYSMVYAAKKKCEESRNWSEMFWWLLKNEETTQKE